MTIVTVVSDLHLEFEGCQLPGGDLLWLLGDTLVADYLREVRNDSDARSQKKRYRKFAQELAKYAEVYLIMGNHEPYHGVLTDTGELIRDFLSEFAPNTRYLENETVEIDGVRFIASTLWATYGYGTSNHMAIQSGMNDFKLIHVPCESDKSGFKTRKFRVEDANRLHQEALAFINEAVQTEFSCVLMTHHAPTYLACNRKRFPNGDMDDAYASNQAPLILANPQIKCWFSGHSHYRYRHKIGETVVAANPRGYYSYERELRFFDPCELDFKLEDFEFVS